MFLDEIGDLSLSAQAKMSKRRGGTVVRPRLGNHHFRLRQNFVLTLRLHIASVQRSTHRRTLPAQSVSKGSNMSINADTLDAKIDRARNEIRADRLDITYGELATMYEDEELKIAPDY